MTSGPARRLVVSGGCGISRPAVAVGNRACVPGDLCGADAPFRATPRVVATDATTLIDESFAPPMLSARGARTAHRELVARGVTGSATYDGLVALAAREHGAVLATRDARARSTPEAVGVTVELLATGEMTP